MSPETRVFPQPSFILMEWLSVKRERTSPRLAVGVCLSLSSSACYTLFISDPQKHNYYGIKRSSETGVGGAREASGHLLQQFGHAEGDVIVMKTFTFLHFTRQPCLLCSLHRGASDSGGVAFYLLSSLSVL